MGTFEKAVNELSEDLDPSVLKSRVWVLRSKVTPYRYVREVEKGDRATFAITYHEKHAQLFQSRLQALKSAQKIRAIDAYEPVETAI